MNIQQDTVKRGVGTLTKPMPIFHQRTTGALKNTTMIRRVNLLSVPRALRVQPATRIVAPFARFQSTEASQESPKAPVDPKISAIVDQISQLTILETSSLVTELKSRLNIPDIAMPAGGAAPAAAPAEAAPAEEEAPKEEKMIFSVKLESFDAKAKPKIIKEVKTLLGMSLVDSKKVVEGAPKVLKDNVPKEDAEKIKQTIEGLGGKITLE